MIAAYRRKSNIALPNNFWAPCIFCRSPSGVRITFKVVPFTCSCASYFVLGLVAHRQGCFYAAIRYSAPSHRITRASHLLLHRRPGAHITSWNLGKSYSVGYGTQDAASNGGIRLIW
jgi:hypothetical protein